MKKTLALILSALLFVSMLVIPVSAGPTIFAPLKGASKLADPDARFDMTNGSLGLRFATQGTAQIKGMSIYTASWDIGTFDFKVYKWEYNYAYSVAQEPVAAVTGISGIASGWLDIIFPAPIDNGEYVAVMDNFGGKLVCNYRWTDNAYTDVYLNGEKKDCSLEWTVEFVEKGSWYKGAELSAETDAPAPPPAGPTLPAEVTYVNTWGGADVERFDGNGTAAIAYRFATQGSGKLIGLNPQIAGEPGKFDLLVYKWSKNYETTIAGTPVMEMKEINFDKSGKWTDYNGNDTTDGPAILFENGLEGGEYLFVMTNFKDTS